MGEVFVGIVGLVITLAILFGIFYLLRSFMLWYWKLDQIEAHLKRLVELAEKK